MKNSKRCFDFIADIFLPNRCLCCNNVIAWNESFCDECVLTEENIYTDASGKSFDEAFSLYSYDGKPRDAVLSFKLGRRTELAGYFARKTFENYFAEKEKTNECIITAVPMARKKQRKRGFNQAELYASEIAGLTGIKIDLSLLIHKNDGTAQHELTAAQRREAAEKAYDTAENAHRLDGKTLILCDDIMTTGSTADCCSKLLKVLGADKVCVLTICKTFLEKNE